MPTPSNSILGKIKNAFLTFATVGLDVLSKILPFISPFLPAPIVAGIQAGEADLSAIASIVTNTEAAFANAGTAATPSAKLAAASPQVQQIVQNWLSSGLPGGAKVQDKAGFAKGVQDLTSAMVTILNSVGE